MTDVRDGFNNPTPESVKRGGVPLLSINFSAMDCPLRGEGGTPHFREEKMY